MNCLKEFPLLSIYTRKQALLRVLKFFEKGHIVFLSIYCQKQPLKGALLSATLKYTF